MCVFSALLSNVGEFVGKQKRKSATTFGLLRVTVLGYPQFSLSTASSSQTGKSDHSAFLSLFRKVFVCIHYISLLTAIGFNEEFCKVVKSNDSCVRSYTSFLFVMSIVGGIMPQKHSIFSILLEITAYILDFGRRSVRGTQSSAVFRRH